MGHQQVHIAPPTRQLIPLTFDGLYMDTSSFRCTGDQVLHLTTSGVRPFIIKSKGKTPMSDTSLRAVRWYTWCHPSEPNIADDFMEVDASDDVINIAPRSRIQHDYQSSMDEDTSYNSESDSDFKDLDCEDGGVSGDEDNDADDGDHAAETSCMEEEDTDKFLGRQSIRAALTRDSRKRKANCRCGVFRTIESALPDAASAILQSDQFARSGPLMITESAILRLAVSLMMTMAALKRYNRSPRLLSEVCTRSSIVLSTLNRTHQHLSGAPTIR